MKVCHMTSAHKSNDIRIFVKECSSLAEFGYDVYLVAQGNDREEKDVHVIGIGPVPGKRIERMTKFVKKIYQQALDIDADVYHFHDPELLPYGIKLKRKGKIVIFDSHEDVSAQILDKTWIPKAFRSCISYVYRRYEAYITKKIDAVVAATEHIKEVFSQKAKQVIVVQNFPKLEDIEYTKHGKTDGIPIICYAGSINEQRGLSTMLSAVKDLNVKLLIAGIGEKDDIAKINNFPNVEYLGELNRKEVNELYKKSSVGLVLLQPIHNYLDSYPIKMFEYMAAGVPFIASDFPLWKKIAGEAGSGINVDVNNEVQIQTAIQNLVSNEKLAGEMSLNGRKYISEKCNWRLEEKKLKELYQQFENTNNTKIGEFL